MRWLGCGGTGTGSREMTEASDSEKTLISRRSSMRPIEPMTTQFAYCAIGGPVTAGRCEGWSSQVKNRASKTKFSAATASERQTRPRPWTASTPR